MALIIKDKIGNVMPGTPTVSDKYDVVTAIVGEDKVVAGQIVALDGSFEAGKRPTTSKVSSTTAIHGVVMHQNIKPEFNKKFKDLQEFLPGEVVGIAIKGFVTAIAKEDVPLTNLKTNLNVDTDTGFIASSGQDLPAIKPTGYKEKFGDKWLLEVEIVGR